MGIHMNRTPTLNRISMAGFESRQEMLAAIIDSLTESKFFAMRHGDKSQVREINARLREAKRRYDEIRSF